jgi:hypothetical protein
VIVVLKLLRGGFHNRRAFLLFLCPVIIAGCDLFDASLVDYYLEHNEIANVTGLAARSPGIMSGEEVLIPPGETVVLGLTLANPRNFTVRQELLDVPEGKDIVARQTGRTEIEVIIAGAAEGDEYRLTLALQSPDGLRDFPAYPLPPIRCVSFETKLRDFTVDGVSAPGFDPALDAFQVNVSYSRSRPVLGATAEHPKAVVEFYAGGDGSGGLLAVGTHTLELPQDLAVGDNHFYLKITAPSASVQGYGLTVHRALASEIGMEGFYFTLGEKRYGVGAGVESGSGSMSGTAITITLPYGTVGLDSLAPIIEASAGASVDPASGTAMDFTAPQTYTVTAEDGTGGEYTVTVDVAKIASVAAVNGDFAAPKGFVNTGSDISGDIEAAIQSVAGTDSLGTVIILEEADYSVDHLVPTATGANGTATLRVPAARSSTGGDITKDFAVYIKSDAKEITEFYFTLADSKKYGVGNGVESGSGSISGDDITVTVPYGTDLTALAPAVTHSGTSIDPASGTAKDFTSPQTYTVTAEDGTTETYTVRVNEGPGITIGGITVDGLGVLTFSGVPTSPVSASTSITITISEGTVTNWYIDVNGPVIPTSPDTNKVVFTAPSTPGFYNVNVIATVGGVGGVDYSGSFGMIVE